MSRVRSSTRLVVGGKRKRSGKVEAAQKKAFQSREALTAATAKLDLEVLQGLPGPTKAAQLKKVATAITRVEKLRVETARLEDILTKGAAGEGGA